MSDAYTRQHDPASTEETCPKCQETPHYHADLHVGHIWTNTRCPAYRSMDGADCDCQQSTSAHYEQAEERGYIHPGPSKVCKVCAARGRLTWLSEDGGCRREDAHR